MEYANLVPYLRKLAKSLDAFVGEDVRSKVLEGCETITVKTSKIKRAEMMKEVMMRMDGLIDKDIFSSFRVR